MQNMSSVRYRAATSADRSAVVALLASESLPTADLDTSGVLLTIAESGQGPVGCIGVQPLGSTGIIRSLAVVRDKRGAGIGHTLVVRAEALASARGIRTLYLLTGKAKDFWAAAGYAIIARASAPPEVQESAEFSSLCPDSAVCMMHDLKGRC